MLNEMLKTEMQAIQQQIVDVKKNKCAITLKKVKCFCKEFGFTVDMLKGSLVGRRKK